MIEEEKATYNTVGLTNEHAVSVGETTFGGIDFLRGTGRLTYYDIMELALQSSTTAREMIAKMDELFATHGYGGTANVTADGGWGTGESFTIADTKEVWHMEIIGKGNFSTGAVWVAQRVPDGFVGGHANQARITTFPRNDPANCLYSTDVVSFAVTAGLYPASAPGEFLFNLLEPLTFCANPADDLTRSLPLTTIQSTNSPSPTPTTRSRGAERVSATPGCGPSSRRSRNRGSRLASRTTRPGRICRLACRSLSRPHTKSR